MKVLWITNTIFPDACKELNIPVPVVGGWMYSSAKSLLENFNQIELAVISFYNEKHIKEFNIDGIKYYLLPHLNSVSNTKVIELYYNQISDDFKPDLVHIHGTEYPHAYAYVKACQNQNIVVSIQGLVSVYQKYYFAGISCVELFKYITLRDVVKNDSMFQQKKRLYLRGCFEEKLIKNATNIIGRTNWDKSHALCLNPQINYFFCNETLRDSFYIKDWNIENCEPFSIFLSQAHYPIKGLHQFLKSVPLLISHFPNLKIYIAGNNIFDKNKLLYSGYTKLLLDLINSLNIKKYICFLGNLNEEQMSEQYCKSNVFVCPSSIENSPNSVGEAQLIGTPCVAAYVGGTMDMIENNVTGLLYRFEEVEMLVSNITKIFTDLQFATKLSKNAKIAAFDRHNKIKNTETLFQIYKEICKK